MTTQPRRLVLRAKLHHGNGSLVTHTISVTDTEVVLACTRPIPQGEMVRLELSFPGLVNEFELRARARESDAGDGHGKPAWAAFEIVEAGPVARDLLGRLVAQRSIAPPAPFEGAYRCLLVEDNPFIRDLFSFAVETYCTDRGAQVVLEQASTAEEGWERVSGARYDLAIIDHYLSTENGLPAGSGSELIARMRADERFAVFPIVAISVGGAKARDASLDAGADLFLEKPLAMRDLFTTLDELTRRRHQ